MGTIQHTAVLVTGLDMLCGPKKQQLQMKKLHKVASDIFGKKSVSNILGDGYNGYKTFMVAPSGSKLGWEPSQEFLDKVDKFIKIMNTFIDKSENTFNYVKLSYGELGPSMFYSGPYKYSL